LATVYTGTETAAAARGSSLFAARLRDNTTPPSIGSSGDPSFYTRPAPGLIDDLRVYDSVLTLLDLNEIRAANLPEPSSLLFVIALIVIVLSRGDARRRSGRGGFLPMFPPF
jgi:hypothetical protein